jgi:hypothetical protein
MRTPLTKFACLDCRKVFKRRAEPSHRICSHCGSEAQRVGSDFKAPPMTDRDEWQVASFLIRRGFPYYRLGIPYPTTMSEAESFVMEHADKAVRE